MKKYLLVLASVAVFIIGLIITNTPLKESYPITNGENFLGLEFADFSSKKTGNRIDYSKALGKIMSTNTAPPGYTLVSSSVEYLYDDLGSALQTLNFTTFAIKFGTCNLGIKSYVLVTSIEDGFSQKLSSQILAEWRNVSAMFNGQYAKIEVFQHNSESGISCPVDQLITTTLSHESSCQASSVCGNTSTEDQSRIPSAHPGIGQHWGGPLATNPSYAGLITEGGGTVWLTANGAFASAGHVINGTTQLFRQIHFNVPASNGDGIPVVPSPDHQYAIDFSTIARSYNSGNRDWAVFKVFPNPNTRLLPHEVQPGFFRVETDNIPSIGFKYGYGIDLYPNGTCGGLNSSNRTLQRTPATNINLSSNTSSGYFSWSGVNEGGDSGGPVVTTMNSVEVAIGSNTNCGNSGTSFVNINFANALNNINGTTYQHVDNQHPSSSADGHILRPYKTLGNAISDANDHSVLSIASGYYNENLTITKPLTLTAPVGTVIIGENGSAKAISNEDIITHDNNIEVANKFTLSQNYPNPFNPSTNIDYSIPQRIHVKLSVFNTLGQEVAVLTDGIKQPGNYTTVFNASQLSSGIYFYILKTGNKELVKQMTLIK